MSTTAPPAIPEDDGPKEYKPSPKVAVVVAGAALAVTTGLTILIIPYVRQAAKMTAPTQFLSHAARGRVLRPNVPPAAEEAVFHAPLPSVVEANAAAERALAAAKAAAAEANAAAVSRGEAPTMDWTGVEGAGEAEEPAPPAPVDPAESRQFNDAEEDYHYGKPVFDEAGAPLTPVSPWLGFQALGIATAIVLGSAGLGVWGAAKYLGVSSIEEFTRKMRGSLEDSLPELVENVRREADEPAPETPDLLDRHGIDIDDNKLRSWVKSWGYGDENK